MVSSSKFLFMLVLDICTFNVVLVGIFNIICSFKQKCLLSLIYDNSTFFNLINLDSTFLRLVLNVSILFNVILVSTRVLIQYIYRNLIIANNIMSHTFHKVDAVFLKAFDSIETLRLGVRHDNRSKHFFFAINFEDF